MAAGSLRERVSFAKRGPAVDDGYGNTESTFADQFTVAARIKPRIGGSEAVTAARLSGRQPYVITVRYSNQTKQITTDWRAQNARTLENYNIRSVTNTDEKKQYLDLLVEAGVAT